MTVDPIAPTTPTTNGHAPETGTWTAKRGLAQMLKGGVIMDVVTADQAKIAEDAGAEYGLNSMHECQRPHAHMCLSWKFLGH